MLLSVREAAREVNVDPQTVYRWFKKGLKRQVIRQGLRMVIRIEKLELYNFVNRKTDTQVVANDQETILTE